MAKKSRRARRGTAAPQAVQIARLRKPLAASAAEKQVDFRVEYHYVVEDLKRIAIIASILLALLIVLAVVVA